MPPELRIRVVREEQLAGFPFTALLEGTKARGHGTDPDSAVRDLFTTARMNEAVKVMTQPPRVLVDPTSRHAVETSPKAGSR